MNAPELNRTVTISFHLLVTLLIASFSLGSVWFSINGIHTRLDDMEEHHNEDVLYLNGEDDGVRADFEKEDQNINKRIDYILGKVERLEQR